MFLGLYVLWRDQWLASPIDEVFAFFADAGNLERITPPMLHFQILPPAPATIEAGSRLQYRISWHGFPMSWKTEIAAWEPPRKFVDVQVSGPYRLWHHTHRFEPQGAGTRMTDVVRYRLPFGPLGSAVHWLVVQDNLEQIFDYRRDRVAEIFGK